MGKVCQSCGSVIGENAMLCPNCGSSTLGNGVNYQPDFQSVTRGESEWNGGVLETFITVLISGLLAAITLGIAAPWAIVNIWKFVVENAVIDGKRLVFDGEGGELFGKWIVWLLLTVITGGIYAIWAIPKMIRWMVERTHFVM